MFLLGKQFTYVAVKKQNVQGGIDQGIEEESVNHGLAPTRKSVEHLMPRLFLPSLNKTQETAAEKGTEMQCPHPNRDFGRDVSEKCCHMN
jgi:hypothetical protein